MLKTGYPLKSLAFAEPGAPANAVDGRLFGTPFFGGSNCRELGNDALADMLDGVDFAAGKNRRTSRTHRDRLKALNGHEDFERAS